MNKRVKQLDALDLRIDALPDGQLEVREVRQDAEGNAVYHRRVITPSDNTSSEPARIKQVVARLHTASVKTAFASAQAARRALDL